MRRWRWNDTGEEFHSKNDSHGNSCLAPGIGMELQRSAACNMVRGKKETEALAPGIRFVAIPDQPTKQEILNLP